MLAADQRLLSSRGAHGQKTGKELLVPILTEFGYVCLFLQAHRLYIFRLFRCDQAPEKFEMEVA